MSDESSRFEDAYDYHECAACLDCWRKEKGDPMWKIEAQHRISQSACCWCGCETLVVHVRRSPPGRCLP